MQVPSNRSISRMAVIGASALVLALLILLASILSGKPAAPSQTVALAGQPTITAPPDVPTSRIQVPSPMSSAEVARATASTTVPPTYTEVVHGSATYTVLAQKTATISTLLTQIAAEPKGVLKEHDFGAWSYKAWRQDNGVIEALVHYDTSSVAGVRAFAAANRDLANQLAPGTGEVEVAVVFRQALSVADYMDWSSKSGLDRYGQIAFSTNNAKGNEAGGSIVSDSSDPWPQVQVDNFFETARTAPDGPMTLNGPFEVDGEVTASRLLSVLADPRVFTVDVTAHIIKTELLAANVVAAEWTYVDSPQLFAAMRRLGLDNFR